MSLYCGIVYRYIHIDMEVHARRSPIKKTESWGRLGAEHPRKVYLLYHHCLSIPSAKSAGVTAVKETQVQPGGAISAQSLATSHVHDLADYTADLMIRFFVACLPR